MKPFSFPDRWWLLAIAGVLMMGLIFSPVGASVRAAFSAALLAQADPFANSIRVGSETRGSLSDLENEDSLDAFVEVFNDQIRDVSTTGELDTVLNPLFEAIDEAFDFEEFGGVSDPGIEPLEADSPADLQALDQNIIEGVDISDAEIDEIIDPLDSGLYHPNGEVLSRAMFYKMLHDKVGGPLPFLRSGDPWFVPYVEWFEAAYPPEYAKDPAAPMTLGEALELYDGLPAGVRSDEEILPTTTADAGMEDILDLDISEVGDASGFLGQFVDPQDGDVLDEDLRLELPTIEEEVADEGREDFEVFEYAFEPEGEAEVLLDAALDRVAEDLERDEIADEIELNAYELSQNELYDRDLDFLAVGGAAIDIEGIDPSTIDSAVLEDYPNLPALLVDPSSVEVADEEALQSLIDLVAASEPDEVLPTAEPVIASPVVDVFTSYSLLNCSDLEGESFCR